MDKERRTGEMPIPDALKDTLNDLQLIALQNIERFGWELRFVRWPLFQDAVPVVFNGEGNMIGVLEEDGRLNLESDIQVRKSTTTTEVSGPGARTLEE